MWTPLRGAGPTQYPSRFIDSGNHRNHGDEQARAKRRYTHQINGNGVKASIDDFGTGYSSLLYLKRLPACELKIDRAFVHELSEAGDGATIVAAIVALAKALNLQIVAEGVENETQQQFLTQLGCHTLQGFLLGKPRTAEEIARDIRDPANIFTRSIYNINSK